MSDIDKLIKQANKKYGSEIISKGSSVHSMPRIPTGSLSLDVETGGGIPVGRITTISGQYSDGKTSIVLKVAANYQRLFPDKDVVWIDAEGAWDKAWSATLGVDPDSVYLVHPEYSQQAFDIAEQCITADCGLLVVDSIAALVPKEEAEASMEDWQVGLAARINNKFIRRTHSSLNDKRTNDVPPTVILINQLRENIGYGQPESEPGGKGIGFAASVRIKVRKGDLYPKAKSNYDSSGPVPKAQQIKFFVEKNKTAPGQTRGHVWFYFDTLDSFRTKGNYDVLEEVIRYAKKYDIIKRRGSYYDLINAATGEVIPFKGANPIAGYLREHPEAQKQIEKEVMEKVASGYVPEEQEVDAGNGNDEDEGSQSGEGAGGQSTIRLRSYSVGEAGHEDDEVSDPAQGSAGGDKESPDLVGRT